MLSEPTYINSQKQALLPTPEELRSNLPLSEELAESVSQFRTQITNIISGQDPRLLVIVGPCSIHSSESALNYADKLATLIPQVSDKLFPVMRTYFEKPRTNHGWRGLLADPNINQNYNPNKGLSLARNILIQILSKNIPTATEFVETITPNYLVDAISWAAIGSRTVTSQAHRHMASALRCPAGFKNPLDGNLQCVINALNVAKAPQHIFSINDQGQATTLTSPGNPHVHSVLRGSNKGPNYDSVSLFNTVNQLKSNGHHPRFLLDTGHDNSAKNPSKQPEIIQSVLDWHHTHPGHLIGFMIESHIEAGKQPESQAASNPNCSITDPCLDWHSTEQTLLTLHQNL